MYRVATIDVGTNTALLLIAEIDDLGQIHIIFEEQQFVRLGEGVDAGGYISDTALTRLNRTMGQYKERVARFGVSEVIVAGTSASRDASNKKTLIKSVYDETGWRFRILSGQEEAKLTFSGAVHGLTGLTDPTCVIDVGGGSTEVILGQSRPEKLLFSESLKVGSVRLTERFYSSVPPTREEIARASRYIESSLSRLPGTVPSGTSVVAVAGTATALTLLVRRATNWSQLRPGERRLDRAAIHAWRNHISTLDPASVRELNPAIMTGREDVFGASLLILDSFVKKFGIERLEVSSGGVRHGLALESWNNHRLN